MRTPITLKIKFKSSNLEQFIERYSVDVSRGGIFIRTKEPLPVGTQLRFEFQLQDASSLIAGDGTVVWIREHDPARQGVAPGMGVKFDRLAAESQKVLDKILSEKQKRGDAQLESRFDAGVRASASASGTLSTVTPRPRDDFSGGDSKTQTPLPGAVPGMETPGDEFGNESTRVMQNELVRTLADRTRGHEEAHNAFSDPEPTRKASVEELKLAVQGSAVERSGDSVEIKQEAKVQIAPEASKPEPLVELKPDAKKADAPSARDEMKAAAVEAAAAQAAKEAKKDEPKPDAKLDKRDEPKLALVESKKDEPKAIDPKTKKAEPEKKKDEPKAAVAAAAPPPPAKKSSSAWMVYAGIAAAALAVGYTVVRQQGAKPEEQPTPPPVVAAQPTPPPAEPVADKPATDKPATDKPAEAAGDKTKEPAAVADKEPAAAAAAAGLSVPVTSDPPGAMITVDGKPLPEPTPTTLGGLDNKKIYDVRVALKGFHEWKIKLKPKTGDKLDAALVPNEKVVEVATTPAGAEVMLDGKRVGKTPYTIHKLDLTKSHALELKRTGFVSQTRSISATDTFESKGDKDVLAVAMTLEAAPTPAPAPPRPHPVAVKKPAPKKPSEAAPSEGAPATAEKPTETTTPSEKPAATEKPAEEKPAAAEKPAAEKPATEKPAAEKPALKSKPEGETSTPPASDSPQQ